MSTIHSLANSLSPMEQELLAYLQDGITAQEIEQSSSINPTQIARSLMWLSNKSVVTLEKKSSIVYTLDTNGLLAHTHGLPEVRIAKALETGPRTVDELTSETFPRGEILSSIGLLKKERALHVEKTEKGMLLSLEKKDVFDSYPLAETFSSLSFPLVEEDISSEQKALLAPLFKRKDFLKKEKQSTTTVFLTEQGKQLLQADIDFSQLEEQLTSLMLKSGTWKGKTFRTYDVQAPAPVLRAGRRHPYTKALDLLRSIYLEMGFQEMSGPWVETCFWCMDAMWIPQDHPARDEQDTFFVKGSGELPKALLSRVQEVHETGGTSGSRGHGSPWNKALAAQLILRTHSTATTFRMFEKDLPTQGKYFYLAKVFRNEAVDATHLAEFKQAEGFVIGENLTLSDLMGFIKEFYARLGIQKIRFKPTYNPYTEPSLEAHYYDEVKKKWYSLINSGIFRPESLYPFGLEDKTILAWGMGATRLASILHQTSHLKDLVGPQVDLDWIAEHKNPELKW